MALQAVGREEVHAVCVYEGIRRIECSVVAISQMAATVEQSTLSHATVLPECCGHVWMELFV